VRSCVWSSRRPARCCSRARTWWSCLRRRCERNVQTCRSSSRTRSPA
jgi:nickel_nikE: nickel import ATP-binding protein NikE